MNMILVKAPSDGRRAKIRRQDATGKRSISKSRRHPQLVADDGGFFKQKLWLVGGFPGT